MKDTQATNLVTLTEKPLAALSVAEIMALTPTEFALFLDGWREAAGWCSPDDRGLCGYVNPHPGVAI